MPVFPAENKLNLNNGRLNFGLPHWFRQEIPDEKTLGIMQLLSKSNVNTVCQEARCPNLSHCFKNLKLTFMILGDTCTRNCRFCATEKSRPQKKLTLDLHEPLRIAKVAKLLGLNYVVITSVTRDDLKDGGASIFAETVSLIRGIKSDIRIEILIPDFKGNIASLQYVLNTQPDVVAHNMETVARLYQDLRPMADYVLSLAVLTKIKELKPGLTTKSSIMLGLGETEEEVVQAMQDLINAKCDILTLGQYLSPSSEHYPVKEFISLERFRRYQDIGTTLGFKAVLSGPLVRSSYQAEEVYQKVAYV